MSDDLRPHARRADNGPWECRFCSEYLSDQSLLSWDMCCTEFELTLEIERLRAEKIVPDGYHVTYRTRFANGTIQFTCKPT